MYVWGSEERTELKYKVDGNKVMIIGPEENFQGNEGLETFTMLKDGSLQGPITGLLKKEK